MATYYMRQLRDDFRTKQMQQLVGGGGLGWLNNKEFVKTNPKRVYSRAPLDENAADSLEVPRTNIQPNTAYHVNENRKFDITPTDPQIMTFQQSQRSFIPIQQSTPYISRL